MLRIFFFVLLSGSLFLACNNDSNKTRDESAATTDTLNGPEQPMREEPMDTTDMDEPDTTSAVTPHETTGAVRLGYINSLEILDKMPAVKQADQKVQQFAQQLDQEIQRKSQELQKTYEAYSKDTDVSEALLKTRMMELQQMQQNLSQLQYSSEQELSDKKNELYKPILKQIDDAIGKVAKRERYTHVMDVSAGALVYGEDRFDITKLVLRQLGL